MRIMREFCAAGALSLLLQTATAPTVQVPDQPSCASCKIEFRPLRNIQPVTTADFADDVNSVAVDNLGRTWVFFATEMPVIFAPTGAQLPHQFRKGRGPREFLYPFSVISLPGDSVLLLDASGFGAILTADLREARRVRTPMGTTGLVIMEWPERVAATATISDPETAGWPMHVFDLSGSDASITRSFGLNRGELRAGRLPDQVLLAQSKQDRLWSADVMRFRIAGWDNSQNATRMLVRSPTWFPGASGNLTRTNPPPPLVASVREDDAGLLWVVVHVPSERWRDAWKTIPESVKEVSARQVPFDKLYRSIVEVIDPVAGRVVARNLFDSVLQDVKGGNGKARVFSSDSDFVVGQLYLNRPK